MRLEALRYLRTRWSTEEARLALGTRTPIWVQADEALRQQASCSACHRVQGSGGDLGPDLTNVGRSKSRDQLVHSILRPSAEISPEWQGWFIRLKNGEKHQGRQIDVGDTTIELQTQAGGFVTFPKKDIAVYGLVRTSLMPECLEAQLTEHDLRDLLAFLQGKK